MPRSRFDDDDDDDRPRRRKRRDDDDHDPFRPGPKRGGGPPFDFNDESRSIQLAGAAGDVLVFDSDLVHAGSRNPSGARRRTVLIGYSAEPLFAAHLETAHLRGVRMSPVEWFEPSPPRGVS